MHGIFHRALKQLVIDERGAARWAALEAEENVGPRDQIGFDSYPDMLTFRLCEAAAGALDMSMDELLRKFGQYWVSYSFSGSYADAMTYTGRTLHEFLGNLDRLHWGVATMFPKAKVPSFGLEELPEGLCVVYRSSRQGLEPMMIGLLEGLLDHFGHEGTVRQLAVEEGSVRFLVTLQDRTQADAA